MFERFTDRARRVLQAANSIAQKAGQVEIDTVHLLAGFLRVEEGVGYQFLEEMPNCPILSLRDEAQRAVSAEVPVLGGVTFGRLPLHRTVKVVVEEANRAAKRRSCDYVGTEHLLIGMALTESWASTALGKYGITAFAIEKWLGEFSAKTSPPQSGPDEGKSDAAGVGHLTLPSSLLSLLNRHFGFDLPSPAGEPMIGTPPASAEAASHSLCAGSQCAPKPPEGVQVGEQAYLAMEGKSLRRSPGRCLVLAMGPQNAIIWPCWEAVGHPIQVTPSSLFPTHRSATEWMEKERRARDARDEACEVKAAPVVSPSVTEEAKPYDPHGYLKGLPKPQTLGSLRKGDWFILFPAVADPNGPYLPSFTYGPYSGSARLMRRGDDTPSVSGLVTVYAHQGPSPSILPEKSLVIPVWGVPKMIASPPPERTRETV